MSFSWSDAGHGTLVVELGDLADLDPVAEREPPTVVERPALHEDAPPLGRRTLCHLVEAVHVRVDEAVAVHVVEWALEAQVAHAGTRSLERYQRSSWSAFTPSVMATWRRIGCHKRLLACTTGRWQS